MITKNKNKKEILLHLTVQKLLETSQFWFMGILIDGPMARCLLFPGSARSAAEAGRWVQRWDRTSGGAPLIGGGVRRFQTRCGPGFLMRPLCSLPRPNWRAADCHRWSLQCSASMGMRLRCNPHLKENPRECDQGMDEINRTALCGKILFQ